MTRPYLRERRAQRITEGQQDMANRCGFCKRALSMSRTVVVLDHATGARYCDAECWADDAERTALMEARR